jgi:hypothetical protein
MSSLGFLRHHGGLLALGGIFVASAVCCLTLQARVSELEDAKVSLEASVERERRLRQEERRGRVNAQKRSRTLVNKDGIGSGFNLKTIGTIESPFPDRRGTPRQPLLARAARGCIRFDRRLIHNDHFRELTQFSHGIFFSLFVTPPSTPHPSIPTPFDPSHAICCCMQYGSFGFSMKTPTLRRPKANRPDSNSNSRCLRRSTLRAWAPKWVV